MTLDNPANAGPPPCERARGGKSRARAPYDRVGLCALAWAAGFSVLTAALSLILR